MKNIYYLFLAMVTVICCTSCNNEWEDEQFKQMVSFKAVPNSDGVTSAYVRYNAGNVVKYNLPIILSGSTMNTTNRNIHIAIDQDTLNVLNRERYGEREELYYRLLDSQYYSIPDAVELSKGKYTTVLPIEFTLGGTNGVNQLNLSEKWILPLSIMDDPSYDYQANPRKHYRKALLNITPFNDYSGTYSGTKYMIYLDDDQTHAFTLANHKAYVHDDKTIFVYAGLRNIDYLDRQKYRVFIKFTDEKIDLQKKKLEIWSDNDDPVNGNAFKPGDSQSYYTVEEAYDAKKPYLKHIYITLFLSYTFEDYTISPGNRLKYTVKGTLSMQRDLNTLIPDEDQQIQWN